MKDRVIVGVLLALGLVASLILQYFFSYAFDVFICAVAILGTIEFSRLQVKFGMIVYKFLPYVLTVIFFLNSIICSAVGLSAVVILSISIGAVALSYLFVFLFELLIRSDKITDNSFRKAMGVSNSRFLLFKLNNTMIGTLYPSFMLFFMSMLNHISQIGFRSITKTFGNIDIALFGLLLVFAIACFTDIFAMVFGSWIKGPKLCQSISPNKTISGALFGLLGGIIGSLLTYFIFSACCSTGFTKVAFWQFILVGLFGAVVAQLGDLFESYVKRRANVKDSGNFLKSHGGVLDRIDSIIFCSPYIFICMILLFA